MAQRFDFNVDDDDFEKLTHGYIPGNTSVDTQKCVKLFESWRKERNSVKSEQIPSDILLADKLGDLCKYLCRFCTETRKTDGSSYPPRTIQHYLMGIQRHIREEKTTSLNLMSHTEFPPLKKLLDALYRKLHSAGVGCSVQKTEAITEDDEVELWSKKVLDPDTPQGLQN